MKGFRICFLGAVLLSACVYGYADAPKTVRYGLPIPYKYNDPNKALINYLDTALMAEKKKDVATYFSAYLKIADIYGDLDRRNRQAEYLLKALKTAEEFKSIAMLSEVYTALGEFYAETDDPEQSDQYFDRLLELSKQTENQSDLADIYDKLAEHYQNTGNKELASQYRHKALAVVNRAKLPKKIAFMHHALSELYRAENMSDSAVFYANRAYFMAFKSGETRVQAVAGLRLSQYHQQGKEIRKAIEYAETAYNKALEIGDSVLARDAALQLGNLYEASGHYRESNTYMRNYRMLADSIQHTETARATERALSQSEYEKREAEYESRIALQQQKLRNQKRVGILMACILALTGTLAYTSAKSALARKKINAILGDQKEELATYNEELAASNEELNRTYKELERHREHLEETVRDKTAKLQEALLQAQESDRFKAAFFANMSHEIRTPLNAVLGFLQFIDDPSTDPEKRKEMIDLINANAMQLLLMVDDIVTLSKIDSGLLTIQPEPFKTADLLHNVLTESQKLIKYANKTKLELIVENRFPDANPILADGKRIEQVLLHLIDNAVKFTDRGYVLFGCEPTENASEIRFFAEDTGIGISGDHLKLIFKRFWKSGDLYTQAFRGIGIGLSLCEELVRLMGGNLSVESEPDKGSVFRFTIKYERVG